MDNKVKIIIGISLFAILGWVLFCLVYFVKPETVDTTKTDNKIKELVKESDILEEKNEEIKEKIDTIDKGITVIKKQVSFINLKQDSLVSKNLKTIQNENAMFNYIDNSTVDQLYGFFSNYK